MHRIGIDIGTTTICAVVLDENSHQLETVTSSGGDFLPSRVFESMQDAESMLKTAKAVIDDLIDRYDVKKIGISCQMHGIAYADESYNIISPLMGWQDMRSKQPADEQGSYLDKIFMLTGYSLSAGYGLATHFYNIKNSLVPKNAVHIFTIGDALAAMLTGSMPKMHASNAASLGLYSLKDGDFDISALSSLGITRSILPKVTQNAKALGTYRGAEVFCALGDNQCSFLGSVPCPKSDVLVNIGTGGQVSWKISSDLVSDLLPICRQKGLEIRPLEGGEFICVGSILCAGRAYALLAKFFAQIRGENTTDAAYELMNRLALESGDALSVDTRFCGSRLDPLADGSITNISQDNFSPSALVRGVINGIASELFSLYIPSDAHNRLVLSGNGARKNPALCAAVSKAFSLPYILSQNAEEAARGSLI